MHDHHPARQPRNARLQDWAGIPGAWEARNEAPMKGTGKICETERGRRKMRGASLEREESRRHRYNSCLRYVSQFQLVPTPGRLCIQRH